MAFRLRVRWNGHIKNVALSPNATLQAALVTACEQHAQKSANGFAFRHNRNVIEGSSCPLRLSGLNKNALIDLCPSQNSSGKSKVLVAVTINRRRFKHEFDSRSTLGQVLEHWVGTGDLVIPASKSPQLRYLNKIFQDMNKTLHELGFKRDSAAFRLDFIEPIASDLTSTPATAIPGPPAATRTPAPAVTPTPAASTLSSTDQVIASSTTGLEATMPVKRTATTTPASAGHEVAGPASVGMKPFARSIFTEPAKTAPTAPCSETLVHGLRTLRRQCFDTDAADTIEILFKVVDNIRSRPGIDSVRRLRTTNKTVHSRIIARPGGLTFLHGLGFSKNANAQTLVLLPEHEDESLLARARQLLQKQAVHLKMKTPKEPPVRKAPPVQAFDPYRAQIMRTNPLQPHVPAGEMSATQRQVKQLHDRKTKLIGDKVPDRQLCAFAPGAAPSLSALMPRGATKAPETEMSDRALLLQDARRRMQEREKNEKFRTKSMRELERLKGEAVYSTTLIRVTFPDGVVLQAVFHPRETVGAIVALVLSSLVPECRHLTFSLYVTPPRTVLRPEQLLCDAGLQPAARIYLSWARPPETPSYLSLKLRTRDEIAPNQMQYPSGKLVAPETQKRKANQPRNPMPKSTRASADKATKLKNFLKL